jgi:hypothetical protein
MNPIYEVDIDFDAASAAWTANKIRRGASYAYRCTAIRKNGKQCTQKALSRPTLDLFCTSHTKYRPAATILHPPTPKPTENPPAEAKEHEPSSPAMNPQAPDVSSTSIATQTAEPTAHLQTLQ